MYLKSIEVQGFKSFAKKILFDFHEGITGIVGPNGSGKSNVADAVRWVLGEQRVKQLRGGSMQDVIFSGTENRRPLSYAYVAITLDNSDHKLSIDFDEVTVTRKIYRSGESEYLLNNSSCRLKDINELFYDTGIGKEGYSIIGQGQIDKVLSGKPEERRELFDEAAGIVKFKRRKNMSIKKLEEERQNLVRVTDILGELEKQIGPLEKQSETAKEYLKKKEELKTYDINMFLLENARLKEQITHTEQLFSNAKDEFLRTEKEYEKTKTEYSKIEEKLDEIDYSMEHAKSQLTKTHLLKTQLENQIELLKEQINSAKMSDEHFAQRSATIREQLEDRKRQQSDYVNQQSDLEKELEEHQKTRDEALKNLHELQHKIADTSKKIELHKNAIITILNERASTKANIQHYDTMLDQMKERKAKMNKRLIEISSNAEIQDEKIEEYTSKLKDTSDRILEYNRTIKQTEADIKTMQRQLKVNTEEMKEKEAAYHRASSRLESLKNMTERYDGYGSSIRKVMEKKENEPGIIGVVADIIKVKKKYETAIETALGGNIQNIVTDHEETAKKMITYLKKNRLGRATFLPLTSMVENPQFKPQEVFSEEGVIGLAHSLVECEPQFEVLADQLLGKTIVVKTIDYGISLAKKYKHSLRIVTLEGELIKPGGSMTGGAFKNSSSLLSRRREIEELENRILQLKEKIHVLEEKELHMEQEKEEGYQSLEQIKERLQDAYVEQNTAKINLDQAHAKKKEASKISSSVKEEGLKLEKDFAKISEEKEKIKAELTTSEKEESERIRQIDHEQIILGNLRILENEGMHRSESIHLALSNLKQKNDFLVENSRRVQKEIEQFEDETVKLQESKDHSSKEITEKEKKIIELKDTIDNSKDLFDEIEREIKKTEEEKESLTKKNKAFFTKREELSGKMTNLDKECFRLNNKKETLEEAFDKQIDYMWDEYDITYGQACKLKDDSLTDPSRIKEKIQTLKGQIKDLGNVNVNAIEDYRIISERYKFLNTQYNDLIEAESTLVKIIDELDEAMRKQFAERFREISKEFDKVFKELFGGGKGTLELMEEEDILEAGIRIIAQPPGKKLQNMMQLSGGEKALTAISLLFAIQNLKPSPFCLLDEIEAALDDSNVSRFAEYLKKLAKNTQFIIITHRRGTMTAADRLYGITMQEKGVSTLVSVDLLENELTK